MFGKSPQSQPEVNQNLEVNLETGEVTDKFAVRRLRMLLNGMNVLERNVPDFVLEAIVRDNKPASSPAKVITEDKLVSILRATAMEARSRDEKALADGLTLLIQRGQEFELVHGFILHSLADRINDFFGSAK